MFNPAIKGNDDLKNTEIILFELHVFYCELERKRVSRIESGKSGHVGNSDICVSNDDSAVSGRTNAFACSHTGCVHTASGAVHLAIWRPMSVCAGHRVSGAHRDLCAVVRTRLRPSLLRAVEGHRADNCWRLGPDPGHLHQRAGHRQVVLLSPAVTERTTLAFSVA